MALTKANEIKNEGMDANIIKEKKIKMPDEKNCVLKSFEKTNKSINNHMK